MWSNSVSFFELECIHRTRTCTYRIMVWTTTPERPPANPWNASFSKFSNWRDIHGAMVCHGAPLSHHEVLANAAPRNNPSCVSVKRAQNNSKLVKKTWKKLTNMRKRNNAYGICQRISLKFHVLPFHGMRRQTFRSWIWHFQRFCAPHLPRADPRADGTALGGPEGTCDGTSASTTEFLFWAYKKGLQKGPI